MAYGDKWNALFGSTAGLRSTIYQKGLYFVRINFVKAKMHENKAEEFKKYCVIKTNNKGLK